MKSAEEAQSRMKQEANVVGRKMCEWRQRRRRREQWAPLLMTRAHRCSQALTEEDACRYMIAAVGEAPSGTWRAGGMDRHG